MVEGQMFPGQHPQNDIFCIVYYPVLERSDDGTSVSTNVLRISALDMNKALLLRASSSECILNSAYCCIYRHVACHELCSQIAWLEMFPASLFVLQGQFATVVALLF